MSTSLVTNANFPKVILSVNFDSDRPSNDFVVSWVFFIHECDFSITSFRQPHIDQWNIYFNNNIGIAHTVYQAI